MRTIKVEHFNLRDSIECGQTFSWVREGEGYINTDIGQAVYVEQHEGELRYETSDAEVNLKKYFRLDDPLPQIQEEITKDSIMRQSVAYAPGLRIVSDEFFPCLISFILSIQSNIPRMHGCMHSLRRSYGPAYEFRGRTFFGFPSPEQLSKATEKDLRDLMFGWRAPFIVNATAAILAGEVTPGDLSRRKYEEAHRSLKTLHGVGNKVADCVCLFSLGHLEAFPIDVWIGKIINQHYDIFRSAGRSYAKMSMSAREYFGRYAGYAQEYLYNYARSGEIKLTG